MIGIDSLGDRVGVAEFLAKIAQAVGLLHGVSPGLALVPARRQSGGGGEIRRGGAVVEACAGNARAGGAACRFGQSALLQARLELFARGRVDLDRPGQGFTRRIECADRQMMRGVAAQARHVRIGRAERPQLGADPVEFRRRPREPELPFVVVGQGGLCGAGQQCAVERRQRNVIGRRDALDLRARLALDLCHRQQQAIAFRQGLAARIGKEQIGQCVLNIGKLAPGGPLIDLHLDELHDRAKLETLLAEMRDQRPGKGTVLAGAVLRGGARRGGKGIDRSVRATDPPHPRHDGRKSRNIHFDGREAACAAGNLRATEGVIATGVEEDDATRRDAGKPAEEVIERQRGGAQRRCGINPCIDREQEIPSINLDTMPGEENEESVGAAIVFGEGVDGTGEALSVAVGFNRDPETEVLERQFDGARIARRICEAPRRPVGFHSNDERHALRRQ